MADDKQVTGKIVTIENRSRRRAVKTLVGGVSALAAYHTLPVNWSTPIIEQVFLPAHAQTSGIAPPTDPPSGGVTASYEFVYLGLVDGHYSLSLIVTFSPPIAGTLLEGSIEEIDTSGVRTILAPTTTYPDTGESLLTDASGQFIVDQYTTGPAADFVSVSFTVKVVDTGQTFTATWTGP